MTVARYACHGLGVVQPIDGLVMGLNQDNGPAFNVVGGFSPPLEEAEITARIKTDIDAGKEIVWIGHSMGAALGFYLPMAHPSWKFKLIITVDPMCWASNINCAEWARSPQRPGEWKAVGNYDRWINIHTNQYPGGGTCVTSDKRVTEYHFPECTHIGVIDDTRVRNIIFGAVK